VFDLVSVSWSIMFGLPGNGAERCLAALAGHPCSHQKSSLFAPIFFGFTFHGLCIRVPHFEPVGRAARTVGRVLPLRHDAFEAHLAGWAKTVGPLPLICSLNRMPGLARSKGEVEEMLERVRRAQSSSE
jgi:hypothetical protein